MARQDAEDGKEGSWEDGKMKRWEDGSEIYLIDDGFQAFLCALLTLKTSSSRQGRIS
jgi:hypothetical protein